MTVVTHKKGIEYLKRKPVLNLLVHRRGMPQLQKNMMQFQQYNQQSPGPVPQQQQQQQQHMGHYSPAPNSPQPQHFQARPY